MFGAPPKPVAVTGSSLSGDFGGGDTTSNNPFVTPPTSNGFFWSGGSSSPFGAAQRLSKSRSPYSLVSKTTALDTYLGSKVSSKRKRATTDDGEDLGKHSETQQHCISLFLKKYRIDEHKFQANGTDGTATMPTIVSAFLSHCRMWHFAYTYAIPTLMDYACSQLALGLAHFVIRATLLVPVSKRLVQFVYKECDTCDSSLRLLIAGFAACVIEDVSRLEGWRGLLTDVPAFKADLGNELLHAMETL
ncbi:nucleoporin FG repeat region domain-containing protein [Metarhizium brunneum]